MTIRRNVEKDGVEISFESKPAAAMLTSLKAAGWRWSRFASVWYKRFSSEAWREAHRLTGLPEADPGNGRDEDESAGFEPGTLANDRRLAKQGLMVARFSSGAVVTQNSRGRCEDAPCCGCCS